MSRHQYEPVAIDSNVYVETDNKHYLSNCQLLTLIINTITIRPCARYILLFNSYLLTHLNFSIIQISYIESARNIGGILSFLFPILISKINTISRIRGYISHRFILSYLHVCAGLLIFSYIMFDALAYYIITRFIFGISVRLFSSYKNAMIATFSKKKDWLVNYALVYLSYPITIVYLIAFGFILNYRSYFYCMLLLSLPLIFTSLLLFIFLPKQSIDDNNTNVSFMEFFYTLNNVNRVLKLIIGFFGGVKISMFSMILSSWFKEYFNVTIASYYSVLLVQVIAEIIGVLFAILYHKYFNNTDPGNKYSNSAIFLYSFSKFIGIIAFGLIYISYTFPTVIHISFEVALLLNGFMYFSSILRSTCGGTLNMQLVSDIPHKRALFCAYKLAFISLGNLSGTLVAAYAYNYNGMESVSLIGCIICTISFYTCCLLWYNMKRCNLF